MSKVVQSKHVADLSDDDLEGTLAGSADLLKDPLAGRLDRVGAHKKAVKAAKAKAKAEGVHMAKPKKKAPSKDILTLAVSLLSVCIRFKNTSCLMWICTVPLVGPLRI